MHDIGCVCLFCNSFVFRLHVKKKTDFCLWISPLWKGFSFGELRNGGLVCSQLLYSRRARWSLRFMQLRVDLVLIYLGWPQTALFLWSHWLRCVSDMALHSICFLNGWMWCPHGFPLHSVSVSFSFFFPLPEPSSHFRKSIKVPPRCN